MLSVRYRYRRILLSVLCFNLICISARFLEAYRYKIKEQYLQKSVGGAGSGYIKYMEIQRQRLIFVPIFVHKGKINELLLL